MQSILWNVSLMKSRSTSNRQIDRKYAPCARRAVHFDPSPMFLDNLSGNCQPQAQTFRGPLGFVAAVEPVEDERKRLRADADARVSDGEDGIVPIFSRRKMD